MAMETSSESVVTKKVWPPWQIDGSSSKRKDTLAEQQIAMEELEQSLAKRYPKKAKGQIQTPTAPTTPMDNTLMEQIHNASGSKYPHFVGYFVQPWASEFDSPRKLLGRGDYPPKVRFMYEEGKELELDVDVSLSFLGLERVIIVGSSMGFLLCCAAPETCTHYFVCNPITRESKQLPEPQEPCAVANIAFLCTSGHATSTSLDRISYEVVRLGMSHPHPFKATTTLEVDAYSSLTGEWRRSSIISPSPVTLAAHNIPAFVVGDVMFWTVHQFKLLGYSHVRKCVQVWDLPWKGKCYSSFLGLSEGRIYCAVNDLQNLEMWVLEDYTRIGSLSGWVLKHRMSITAIKGKNPGEPICGEYMGILGFHPWNSQLILLSIFFMPYWYNSEDGKMKAVDDFEPTELLYNYICYEWPYNRSA
ncbi:F-box protein At5g49610-like isoform X2 [Coffea arabica]|uniref:F-box protein At5g49610-like isoform X2 n=1 Tax=Coffea arabica TaxID=13443 RepID=A0A6P6VNJ8_COFAR|nr:F-box protein At5g49610-like isoform X2 [Coffea arabica]